MDNENQPGQTPPPELTPPGLPQAELPQPQTPPPMGEGMPGLQPDTSINPNTEPTKSRADLYSKITKIAVPIVIAAILGGAGYFVYKSLTTAEEEPAVEEPVVEEPVAEEPAAETPFDDLETKLEDTIKITVPEPYTDAVKQKIPRSTQ